MTTSAVFEIKIALLGHVSVGKTTVLNALFQDKYSEVSMTRTTAAVNHFYISSTTRTKSNSNNENNEGGTDGSLSRDTGDEETACTEGSNVHDESSHIVGVKDRSNVPSATTTKQPNTPLATTTSSASDVLEKITEANKRLRESPQIMEEQTFHIHVADDWGCKMRDDTQLVVIDIPGLNEQGSRDKYKTYVSHHWKTWDCAIVVMDASQGVNSDEQVQLLETVKHYHDTKKQIPIIILCNKLDDPEDEERAFLVQEVRKKVEAIFHVTCRQDALKRIILMPDNTTTGDDETTHASSNQQSLYPVFLPLAAAKAFLYRATSRLTLEEYRNHYERFKMDELVRDEVGRFEFRRLSTEEKYATAYRVISDPTQYQERLGSTNFDKFMIILAKCVGGTNVQRRLLQKQMVVALDDITLDEFLILDKVQSIADKYKMIANPSEHIRTRFWAVFRSFQELAFKNYRQDMDVVGLSTAADLLVNYHKLSSALASNHRTDDTCQVVQALHRILKFQCQVIEQKACSWNVKDAAFMNRWIKVGKTGWVHHGTGKTVPISNNSNESPPPPPTDSPFHWDRSGKKGWKNKYTNVKKDGPTNPAQTKPTWQNLSPYDWNTILASVLLASYSRHFVQYFGTEKVRLENLIRHGSFATYLQTNFCVNCISEVEKKARNDLASFTDLDELIKSKGNLAPCNPTGYSCVFQVVQPSRLSDQSHWGHVGWQFCHVAESLPLFADLPLDDDDFNDNIIAMVEPDFPTGLNLPTEDEALAKEQGDY